MNKTLTQIVLLLAIASVLTLGTLPFLQLFWNHPFEAGTADIITFAQHAKQTISSGTITAKGTHGFFTALQLFPFLFLQSVVMTLVNSFTPILNLWVMQHVITFLNTSVFFVLGRKCTRSILGGIITAATSFMILDIPIWNDAGLPRYLSTFQYSSTFLFCMLAFFPDKGQHYQPWITRFLVLLLGAAVLFSHHHFGLIRIAILLAGILLMIIIAPQKKSLPLRFLIPSLQAILFAIFVLVLSNLAYLDFFLHDFVKPFIH